MGPRDASRHVAAKLLILAETPYRLLDFSIALLGAISLDDRIIVCGIYLCGYVRWHIRSVFETGPTNNNCLYGRPSLWNYHWCGLFDLLKRP